MNYKTFFKKALAADKQEQYTPEELQEYKDMVVNEINNKIANNEREGLSTCLTLGIIVHLETVAKYKILNGDPSGWQLIEQQICWQAYAIKHATHTIFISSREFGGIIGLSMHWGYDEMAAAVAARAGEIFMEDQEEYSQTEAIHVFVASLYYKYQNGELPPFFELIPATHVYQRLMAVWEDDAAVADLLPEVCEYHIWSAYDDHKEKMTEILSCSFIPFDIRAIELVRKKEGLNMPDIDHPLMKTPLADIPVERPGYDPATDATFQLVLKNEA